MPTVLLVLACLVIVVLGINLRKKSANSTDQRANVAPAKVEFSGLEPATDNRALIAVITAAVAAAIEADGESAPGGFVVRGIRRVHGGSAWNRAGREEQIYGRF